MHVAAAELVSIGSDCVLASGVYVTDHDHGVPAPGQSILDAPLVTAPTRIGDRVWIGERAMVLKGVTVGDGSVVGAGAVVTKDVAPGTTVVGVPARPIER